jgi:CBS domain containing-hemolysin-like protein
VITTVVVPIAVILVLVVVNGVFVAAEFALVGARPSRLETLAASGNRGARWLVAVIERPTGKDGYIAVAQLGITLASIGLGMYGEPAVAGWLYGPFEDAGLSNTAAHTVGFIVALSGITFLHVVFGEMIPKALALQAPEDVSVRVNPVMRAFSVLFRPMVAVLNAVALRLMRLLGIREPDKGSALYTSTELAIVTDESAESGSLGAMQRNLIRRVFDLDERTAEELMTQRSSLEAIDASTPLDELSSLVERSVHSRYPVIDGDLDHVVGMVHVKDLIRAEQRGQGSTAADLVRPLPTVVASASAEQLLDRFREDRTHACLVVDEFGATLGMVTLDDVIAEVMDDEVSSDRGSMVEREDGSLSVAGDVTLAELREDRRIDLVEPGVSTVAGLVLARSGVIPTVGDAFAAGGHELVVEEVVGRRIARVQVRPSPAADRT